MSNKTKSYTVVGLCLCGCNESFVYHADARTPTSATKKVDRLRVKQFGRHVKDSRIVAVFEGEHTDVLETRH